MEQLYPLFMFGIGCVVAVFIICFISYILKNKLLTKYINKIKTIWYKNKPYRIIEEVYYDGRIVYPTRRKTSPFKGRI